MVYEHLAAEYQLRCFGSLALQRRVSLLVLSSSDLRGQWRFSHGHETYMMQMFLPLQVLSSSSLHTSVSRHIWYSQRARCQDLVILSTTLGIS